MKVALSKKQKAIVKYNGDFLAVIAGAGSGKTRVLTQRVEYLLSNVKEGQKIVAITFSNKAAKELRERLENQIDLEGVSEKLFIGTTHTFCLKIIKAYGALIGLPDNLQIFSSDEDRLRLFSQAIENIPYWNETFSKYDENKRRTKMRETYFALSKKKRELKFSEDFSETPASETLFKEYDELLLSNGAIDYDDIIRYAYKILASNSRVRNLYSNIYQHICVDEAQDLNRAQYEFIKAFSNQRIGITLVGDPKQAIYGFNGASSRFLTDEFFRDFPQAKKEIMSENFRSAKEIINHAKKLNDTYEIDGKLKYKGEFSMIGFKDEQEEASWVVEKIEELMSNGHPDVEGDKIHEKQVCILARNRYVFDKLIKELKDKSLEYTLKSSLDGSIISETDFFKAFELGLRVIANPNDKLHLNDLLELRQGSEKANCLSELMDNIDGKSELDSELCKTWRIASDKNSDVKFQKVLDSIKTFIEKLDTFDDEKNMMISDFVEWERAWSTFVSKSGLGKRKIQDFLNSISLGELKMSEATGFVLSTVHMSKGLEFDVVFIIGACEGVFPDYRSLEDKLKIEEEQHNMFVAITRSKRLCYITFPKKIVSKWGSVFIKEPSRFLKQMGYKN